jgi:very-short-patch-repair endonuclease
VKHSNIKKLLSNAQDLRENTTPAESRLWHHLRSHRFAGIKFKRQQPIGPYIVDFVCLEKRLIIELDGGQHAFPGVSDVERDAWLLAQGFTVLRFWNNEVLGNLAGVLDEIGRNLEPPAGNEVGEDFVNYTLPLEGGGRHRYIN